jgi:hypothetical protein
MDNKCVLKVMRKAHKLLDGQLVGDVAIREISILSDLQVGLGGTEAAQEFSFHQRFQNPLRRRLQRVPDTTLPSA